MAKKICLFCGLHLPDTTTFCPECGRPIEAATRVESGVEIRNTTIIKCCQYCGFQLPDTAHFCPECGRPTERGFEIRPTRESKIDCPQEVEGKDNLPLLRQWPGNCKRRGEALDVRASPLLTVEELQCNPPSLALGHPRITQTIPLR